MDNLGLLHRLLICWLILLPVTVVASPVSDNEQLIAQGQEALAAGRAEQAVLIFEGVLLDQPWRLGIWLDYALALQQSGDVESARAIYRRLLSQNPPEHLLPWLRQQANMDSTVPSSWVYTGMITLLAGYDSNLNRAPSISSLTLTLPSGPLVLSLSDTAQASAGEAALMQINWTGAHQAVSGNDWLLQAGLITRVVPGSKTQDYLQPSLGITRRLQGDAVGETLVTLALQQLQYGGQHIQSIRRAGLYRAQQDAGLGCSLRYGAEWESQNYPLITVLSGRYAGLAAGLGCSRAVGWQLQARAGINRADSARPGGDQKSMELRARLNGRLGKGGWLLETELMRLLDSSGYSPLLDSNALRDIWRAALRLEYAHSMGKQLHILYSVEAFRQNSSLSLFAMHGNAAWLGFRYGF